MQAEIFRIKAKYANAYLVTNGKDNILIDTGFPSSTSRIKKALDKLNVKNLSLILITHGHIDHVGSAGSLKEMYGAPVAMHPADMPKLTREGREKPKGRNLMGSVFAKVVFNYFTFLSSQPEPVDIDIKLHNNFPLTDFGFDGIVYHTPGHTMGSVTVVIDNFAVVGDTITKLFKPIPAFFIEDVKSLWKSIEFIRNLDLEWIYPGHGKAFRFKELEKLKFPER